MNQTPIERARLKGLALLTKKPYTVKQLRDKFAKYEFAPEVIDDAIDYLKGYGYVDDVNYAVLFFETYRSARSLKRMMYDLSQKGVSKEDMEAAMAEIEESGENVVEEESQIRHFLERKKYDPDTMDYKEIQKIKAALFRKGYNFDLIEKCMK